MAEVDANDNGLLDLAEFLPLATDLVTALRARSASRRRVDFGEEFLRELAAEDLDELCQLVLNHLRGKDIDNRGAVSIADFRTLSGVSSIRLCASEVSLLTRFLPRDETGGAIVYREDQLRRALFEVRLRVARMMMAETAGSDVESHLLRVLLELEDRGNLTPHSLMRALLESKRLSLTRLQAVILASEAVFGEDGRLDLYRFASSAGSTLETMFSASGVRERAELLRMKTADARGEGRRDLEQRLIHMFRQHDADGSGDLDFDEFSGFLGEVAGSLTPAEVRALWLVSDADDSGRVSFAEFSEFCAHNLEHLQRERKVRERTSQRHRPSMVLASPADIGRCSTSAALLLALSAADNMQMGFLEHAEVVRCIENAMSGSPRVVADMVVSEVDDLPLVDHVALLDRIGPLLSAISEASVDPGLEQLAAEYSEGFHRVTFAHAIEALKPCLADLNSTLDPMARRYVLSKAMKRAQLSLSRCQRNWVSAQLRTSDPVSEARLAEVVRHALRLSTARQLLVPLLPQSLLEYLMQALSPAGEELCSVEVCLETLESLPRLDFTRGQLIGMLSLCDCLTADGPSKELLVRRRPLAYYLSKQVSSLHDLGYLRRRHTICASGSLDELRLLAGTSKEDSDDYLGGCFSAACTVLTLPQLREALRGFPGLELTNEEVHLASAALRLSSDSSKFDAAYLTSTVRAVLSEMRMEFAVYCRMPFAMVASEEEGLRASGVASLKSLALKLAGGVVVQIVDKDKVTLSPSMAAPSSPGKLVKALSAGKTGPKAAKPDKVFAHVSPFEFQRLIDIPTYEGDDAKPLAVSAEAKFFARDFSVVAGSVLSLTFRPAEAGEDQQSWVTETPVPHITLLDADVAEAFLDRILPMFHLKRTETNALELHSNIGHSRGAV